MNAGEGRRTQRSVYLTFIPNHTLKPQHTRQTEVSNHRKTAQRKQSPARERETEREHCKKPASPADDVEKPPTLKLLKYTVPCKSLKEERLYFACAARHPQHLFCSTHPLTISRYNSQFAVFSLQCRAGTPVSPPQCNFSPGSARAFAQNKLKRAE